MNGFLIINKPKGLSSHDVINRLRKILGTRKIGHAGTLDPLATGVLVVCVGNYTRLAEYLVGLDKEYAAEITLGAISDTYDAEGQLVTISPVQKPSLTQIRNIIKKFTGDILQTPPSYSAIKIKGRKAYEMARAGKEVKIKPRVVKISAITLQRYDYPKLKLVVQCGSGTYIRSLAHDLGEKLGCGGYLSELKRTKVGDFTLEQAVTLEDLAAGEITQYFLNPLEVLKFLQLMELSSEQKSRITYGDVIPGKIEFKAAQPILGLHEGQVIAILRYDEKSKLLKPQKVFL